MIRCWNQGWKHQIQGGTDFSYTISWVNILLKFLTTITMISYKNFTLNQGKKILTTTRRKLPFTLACLHELNFFLQIKVWFSFVFSHHIFKKPKRIVCCTAPQIFKYYYYGGIFYEHFKVKLIPREKSKNLKFFWKKKKK